MIATAGPRASVSTQQINVTYNPNAPLGERFTLNLPNNLLMVDPDNTDGTIPIQLTVTNAAGEPIQFSPNNPGAPNPTAPIIWSVPPTGGVPDPIGDSPTSVSVNVPPPVGYFKPWAFRVSIDAELQGIRSPLIFIVLSPALPHQESCSLVYSPANGSFTINQSIELAQELVLINTIFPFKIPITVTGATFAPAFTVDGASTPVLWNPPGKPIWMTEHFDPENPDFLMLEIGSGGVGQSAGFSVAVEVDGVQVLSPDPILVNATLGDGN